MKVKNKGWEREGEKKVMETESEKKARERER